MIGAFLVCIVPSFLPGTFANGSQGVFVASPVGSLVFMAVACALRLAGTWVWCKATHRRFMGLDIPVKAHCTVSYEDGHLPFGKHGTDPENKVV